MGRLPVTHTDLDLGFELELVGRLFGQLWSACGAFSSRFEISFDEVQTFLGGIFLGVFLLLLFICPYKFLVLPGPW